MVNCSRNWFVWTLLILCTYLPCYYSFSLTPALLWHFSGKLTTVLQFIKPSTWIYQLPPGNRSVHYMSLGDRHFQENFPRDTTLERRTLFTLSFIKIIQRQKYWHFCQNGRSPRGEEAVLEMTSTTVVPWLFRAKKSLLKGENVYTWLCASDSLWVWLWNLLEALMKPRLPDPRGILTVFYILSLVCMKENSKLSPINYFEELNWSVWDIITGLGTNS